MIHSFSKAAGPDKGLVGNLGARYGGYFLEGMSPDVSWLFGHILDL
jgi:hypothetical protein